MPPQLLAVLTEPDLAAAVLGRLANSREMKQVVSFEDMAPCLQTFRAEVHGFLCDRLAFLAPRDHTTWATLQGACAQADSKAAQ